MLQVQPQLANQDCNAGAMRHYTINQRSKLVISCKCNRKASNDNDRCGPRERRRGRDKRRTYTELDGPDQCT